MTLALGGRKQYSSIDLQQVVCNKLIICKRNLNSGGTSANAAGTFLKLWALKHKAVQVQVTTGEYYIIEKGVPESDDVNVKLVYREHSCRIALIKTSQLQNWDNERAIQVTNKGVTLEMLLTACGQDYNVTADNCWNGVERMCSLVNSEEVDKWSWQKKTVATGVGVFAAGVAVLGIGAAIFGALSQKKDSDSDDDD